MSENRVNKLEDQSVKAQEIFGDKIKLSFSENPKKINDRSGLVITGWR